MLLLKYSIQYQLFLSQKFQLLTFCCLKHWIFIPLKSHPCCKWAGVFLRKNTVLLAARAHSPLRAPVTMNDAKPSCFFGRMLLFAGARVWFPVVAQISLGMLREKKPSLQTQLTGVLCLLTWGITLGHVVAQAGRDLKLLRVRCWTRCHPLTRALAITRQKHASLHNNNGTHIRHKSLETN